MFKLAAIALTTLLVTSAHANLYTCFDVPSQSRQLEKIAPSQDPCVGHGTSVVALTQTAVIYLCEANKTKDHFDVALGRGGVSKALDGDLKTPLGTYSLSAARVSERFGLFIPIGYPTTQQRARGFTGGAVGIHGPIRIFACAGLLNVSFNWTQGCLAVASDLSIQKIAKFLESHPAARQIHIF